MEFKIAIVRAATETTTAPELGARFLVGSKFVTLVVMFVSLRLTMVMTVFTVVGGNSMLS